MENMWIVWLIVAAVCLLSEVLSAGTFYLFCLCVGALCAALSCLFGGIVAQVIVFVVASLLSVLLLRPVVRKWFHRGGDGRVSNADAIIGRVGRVTEAIPSGGFGRVAIDGDDWKSQSDAPGEISVGSRVQVVARDSLILTVKPINL